MTNITRKRTGELLRKLFEILLRHPDGMQAGDALKNLAASVTLSDYEKGHYERSAGRRFEKIVRFATVDCVKAGWLSKHKGTWTLTADGIDAYKSISDAEAFYKEAVRLYHQWKAAQQGETDNAASEGWDTNTLGEKSARITFEEAEEQAWSEIEQFINAKPPLEVQDLVADLLRAMSYHISWVAPPGKDGGVDIIAYSDPLGTRPPRIKVQVKRQQSKVDLVGLKSFLANVSEDDVGIFVSTGGFTRDANDHARSQERRKITLIDIEKLIDLWIEFSSKLDDAAKKRLPLRPIYFLNLGD